MSQFDPSDAGSIGQTPATGDPRADLALQQTLVVMAPLVRWLLRSGVQYGSLSQALKAVFLAEARSELQRSGTKVTDSALSVLSGVHRKDVRAITGRAPARVMFTPTPASALFTRWIGDPKYRTQVVEGDTIVGKVITRIPRLGEAPSFEALARDVSTDVHPRTLLEELVRLGLVQLDGEDVVLMAQSFVPERLDPDAAAVPAANSADHLAAVVHNLTRADQPRFLEQAVFAKRLSPESVELLAGRAREIWQQAFESMTQAASDRLEVDQRAEDRGMRMRFGVYYFHDRFDEGAPQEGTPQPGKPSTR